MSTYTPWTEADTKWLREQLAEITGDNTAIVAIGQAFRGFDLEIILLVILEALPEETYATLQEKVRERKGAALVIYEMT